MHLQSSELKKTQVTYRNPQNTLFGWQLKLFPLFCMNARSRTDNKDEVVEGKFRNLNFSPSTKRQLGILLNFFFPIFFSSLKLQHCRTIVLLHCLPQSTGRFPAKKIWHSPLPVGLPWDYLHPPPESVRTEVRTYGRTLTSEPNFLASIG